MFVRITKEMSAIVDKMAVKYGETFKVATKDSRGRAMTVTMEGDEDNPSLLHMTAVTKLPEKGAGDLRQVFILKSGPDWAPRALRSFHEGIQKLGASGDIEIRWTETTDMMAHIAISGNHWDVDTISFDYPQSRLEEILNAINPELKSKGRGR